MLNTLSMFMQHRSFFFLLRSNFKCFGTFLYMCQASIGRGNVYLFLPSDFVESVTKLKLIAAAKQYAIRIGVMYANKSVALFLMMKTIQLDEVYHFKTVFFFFFRKLVHFVSHSFLVIFYTFESFENLFFFLLKTTIWKISFYCQCLLLIFLLL